MKRIYKKVRSAGRKRDEVKVLVARGKAGGKRSMRPPGVKGRYKVVDTRMKKDLRAQKNKAKTMGRAKGAKGKGAKGRAAGGGGRKRK